MTDAGRYLAAGLMLLMSASAPAAAWVIENVDKDPNSDVGRWPNIYVDPGSNIPIIVYHDSDHNLLLFAIRDRTEDEDNPWDIPESLGSVTGYISMDAESSYHFHACYVRDGKEFVYVTYDGGWNEKYVYDPGYGSGAKDTSIVLDDEYRAYLAMYVDAAAEGLKYNSNYGGNFLGAPESVGAVVQGSGWGNSMVMRGNEVFIGFNDIYWDGSNNLDYTNVMFKSREASTWNELGKLDDNYNANKGRVTAVAVADDKVHIIYLEDGYITYAYHNGNDWKRESNVARSGPYIDMDLAGYNEPRIVYYNDDPGDQGLRYAYKNDNGKWKFEDIEDEEDIGYYDMEGCSPSVKVDSSGTVHVAYYDRKNRNLKYAYKAVETIDENSIDAELDEEKDVIVGNNKFVPGSDNGECRIMYNLGKHQTVSIKIYDLTGNLVKTVIDNEEKDSGVHGEDRWDGSTANKYVTPGIYYIVVEGEGWKKTSKVAVVKE
ncbi:MAG: T9SS type A sorting domain-containing protein [Elusimicrobia bacterium]|nr:T9SS type A sorting domain-containing protein [Elusimicrobiota bacterium]